MRLLLLSLPLAVALLAGCPPPSPTPDAGPAPDDAGAPGDDAGAGDDAGSGPLDAGPGPNDAGPGPLDAGPDDAGPDSRRDQCTPDAGCANGACLALPTAPDATRFCVVSPDDPFRHECAADGGLPGGGGGFPNECCTHTDCAPLTDGGPIGVCAAFSVGYCGGAPPPDVNSCRYHQCETDDDCRADSACLPAGAFGNLVRTCVLADCRVDADCTARAGGECRPLRAGACASVSGFYCTYADDPCREDSDCPAATYPELCVPDPDGGTRCQENLPAP